MIRKPAGNRLSFLGNLPISSSAPPGQERNVWNDRIHEEFQSVRALGVR